MVLIKEIVVTIQNHIQKIENAIGS